jgi:hypothetical protein
MSNRTAGLRTLTRQFEYTGWLTAILLRPARGAPAVRVDVAEVRVPSKYLATSPVDCSICN